MSQELTDAELLNELADDWPEIGTRLRAIAARLERPAVEVGQIATCLRVVRYGLGKAIETPRGIVFVASDVRDMKHEVETALALAEQVTINPAGPGGRE